MEDQEAVLFNEVYRKECEEIRERRSKHFFGMNRDEQTNEAEPPRNLVGLALSGGGIRSATFCLGVLQGLHKLRLLRIFDFLSTVSGGGYVGGWWSAWLSRDRIVTRVDDKLALLMPKDIKNPSGLVAKLQACNDSIVNELRDRFSATTVGLLNAHDPAMPVSHYLIWALTDELNKAILAHFFYKPSPCVMEDEVASREGYQRVGDLNPDKYPLLANRLRLEEIFPYELRDIFPSREKIETDRPRPAFVESGEKEHQLYGDAAEDPIHQLRLYANYLTPRRGVLSADTWRAISVILRNLVFTWLVLLPVLIAVMLLGQLYFLLLPATRGKFLGGALVPNNIDILVAISWPLAAILGWIIVMAIAWLICNRDQSSRIDWIIQIICMMAVVALVSTAIHIKTPLWPLVEQLFTPTTHLWLLLAWASVPIASVIYVVKGANRQGLSSASREAVTIWQHEVRRNRIGNIQAWLLVLFACTGAVLTLAGFSHKVVRFLFKPIDSNIHFGRLFGLLPVISAIAGLIFTAFKASPAGGSDRNASREPSAIARFVFAVTPGLVVVVVAVLLSWLSYRLLGNLWDQSDRIHTLLFVGGLYGISLCLALAVYEMKWLELEPTLPIYGFLSLLIINVSWGAVAMYRFIKVESLKDPSNGLLLLGFSIFFGLLVGIFVYNRVASGGRWKRFISMDSDVGVLRRLKGHPGAYPLAVAFVFLLFGLGAALSWLSINEHGMSWKINSSSLPLGLAALGGSIILFRLATYRPQKDSQHKFEIRFFRDNPVFKRPEAIWVLGSICIALPVAIVSWVHALIAPSDSAHRLSNLLFLSMFPIALALLPVGLIFFRTLVANAYGPDIVNGNLTLQRWFGKVNGGEFNPKNDSPNRKRTVLRTVVGGCVAAGMVGGYWAFRLDRSPVRVVQQLDFRVPRSVLLLFAIFAVTLFVFRTAIVHLPLDVKTLTLSPGLGGLRKRLFVNKGFNWAVAISCIGLAFFVGFLNTVWVQHVKEYPNNMGIASIALPGMVACFNLTVFEIWWGESDNRRSLWLFWFAFLGLSLLFVVGTLIPGQRWDVYLKPLTIVLGLLTIAIVWIVALGWMVDPNSVAMHQFYKGRLTRAYLGASNLRRREEVRDITEAVGGDDMPLDSLKNCRRGGPYHLVNTTLNLVAGRDLATEQRSASSFVLSSGSCGSSRTNYRPTSEYMKGLLTLGTAVAASGAAVSPSMGSKKPTAALAMLITLLNVRLGYWAPTPNRHNWKMGQPRLWPFYLLREFLSQTNDLSSYCYLTDGGHFDNTGLYSLVERGCRFIVLVDCGADPKPSRFEDLGEAIRRCRIDFGTEFKLDIESFIEDGQKKPTRYFVTGGIRYSRKHARSLDWDLHPKENTREDKQARTGVIVYFKPSIIGKETADVRQYAIENASFPHQTTTNQWFDEAQFESYRRLGQLSAKDAFGGLTSVEKLGGTLTLEDIESIFREIDGKEPTARELK